MAQQLRSPAGTPSATFETTATATRLTRRLLACGVVAGPLFFTVGLAQSFTCDGFDPSHHALSLLENGRLGWIQISNFVITGLLSIACAIGAREVVGLWAAGGSGAAARGRLWDGRGQRRRLPRRPGRRLPARHPWRHWRGQLARRLA